MNKLLSSVEIRQGIYPMKEQPQAVQFIQYKKGEKTTQTLSCTQIVLITKGAIRISYDHFFDCYIGSGKIILLPPGCHFTLHTKSGAEAFIFRFSEAIDFITVASADSLIEQMPVFINNLNCLDMNPGLVDFLSFIQSHMQNKLCREDYLQLKAKELLYLLQHYYTREQLTRLFFPLLTTNGRFHNFVLMNYRGIKTVRQFAKLYNCSVSNFEKKFQQTFGISTFQWMQQQKIKLLYHEINATDKPLRQIAVEQKFLSLPQFNDYCKKHFGYPPGKMRKLSTMFRV